MSISKTLDNILTMLSRPSCQLVTLYQIEKELGSVEQKWTVSAVDTPTAAGHTYLDAFTETDAEGLPAHPNPPDIVDIQNTAAATTNFTQTDEITDDQAIADFWLCLPETVEIGEFLGSAEAVGVWMSKTCGSNSMKSVLNAPYLNSELNELGFFDAGYYRVRLYHHDVTQNGAARLVYKNAAGNYAAIPQDWVAKSKPIVTPIQAWCCDDGKFYNKDKTEELELSDELVYDKPCAGAGCLTCG